MPENSKSAWRYSKGGLQDLPAFSIGIGELEALVVRLVALFENPEDILSSIVINLHREELTFDDTEELKQYPDLKGRITNFSLTLFINDRSISVDSSEFLNPRAVARATGPTEAWCAGAVETVYSFIQSYKSWYSWFVTAPIGWILVIYVCLPSFVILAPESLNIPGYSAGPLLVIGWLSTLTTLAFLYVFRSKLFPASVIRITDEENLIRRYSAELGLIIALFSVILTIIGMVVTAKSG